MNALKKISIQTTSSKKIGQHFIKLKTSDDFCKNVYQGWDSPSFKICFLDWSLESDKLVINWTEKNGQRWAAVLNISGMASYS